jgi:hypothetical protein
MRSFASAVAAVVVGALLVPASAQAVSSPPQVFAFGSAAEYGTVSDGSTPVVGMTPTASGKGYWLADRNGGVYSFGDASFYGSLGGVALNAPIVGLQSTASGHGYWLVARDGGVFAFGDAAFYGSMGGKPLNQPIVGMTRTASGDGYWFVAADGGVFAYGDAAFAGSMGGRRLNEPIVGMAANPCGCGYWLVARDGGVFAFGQAPFYGSMGGQPLNEPIVAMASTNSGNGYWFVAADGGVFAFGDAAFYGGKGATVMDHPIVGMAAVPTGGGYWMVQGRSSDALEGVAAILAARSGRESVAVYDNVSGATYVLDDGTHYSASIAKVNILATAARDGLSDYEKSVAVPMIRVSDNDAADRLWSTVGGFGSVSDYDRSVGITSTSQGGRSTAWGLTRTTASDQVLLMRQVAYPSSLPSGDRAFALDQMHNVTSSQRWGVTAGTHGAPVAVKNGWLNYGGWIVNSIGWVHGNGHDYTIAVLTDGAPSMGYGIDTIQAVSSRVYANLG